MSLRHALAHRQLQPELMDDPAIDPYQHHLALRGLSRLNALSNTAGMLWRHLYQLHQEVGGPVRVLDLACGGGDVICALARMARQCGLPFDFAGCDKSATAVEHAQAKVCRSGVNSTFFVYDVIRQELPMGFDVVMCSLFLHHLKETQSQLFLRKMANATTHMVLVSDLRRTRSGWLLAQIATRILSRSHVVHFDGPRSVEGAYNCSEIRQLAESAGMESATITRCWPQRFLLTWRKTAWTAST